MRTDLRRPITVPSPRPGSHPGPSRGLLRVLSLAVPLGLSFGMSLAADAATAQPGRARNPDLTGTFESAVVLRDCATAAVLRTFRGLGVFHRGGTASATNSMPPAGNGPAFGTWSRDGVTHTVRLRLYRFAGDGSFAGATDLTRVFELAADGRSFEGSVSARFYDPADVLVSTACGSETAVRVTEE